jgi:sugar lactone lactonase YvrE
MYYPSASAADSAGNLWVVDSVHSRVLEFETPFTTGMSASLAIGEPNFTTGNGGTSQSLLGGPSAITFDSSGNLWVPDAMNCRVLEFKPPFATGMNADLVIGQTGFSTSICTTTSSGMGAPFALAFDSAANLWVADTWSNRILEYQPPFTTGMSASLVIGQPNFTSNATGTTSSTFTEPTSIAFDSNGDLWAADPQNNRVLEFQKPFTTGMSASLVLGQSSFTSASHATTKNSFALGDNAGIAFDSSGNLWITDVVNNRVLEFTPPFSNDQNASLVLGQVNFTTNTLNSPSASSLYQPGGVSAF